MYRSILFATAMCVFATTAIADQILVPQQYSTIQAAINEACDGDEIIVDDGTYHEAIDFLGKAITLRSSDGPDATVIDGTGKDSSVVRCDNDETPETVLDGFTITGGEGTDTAGYRHGGGLYARSSYPTIRNCVFANNRAEAGGGVSLYMAWATIENCIFQNNEATFGGERGGGALHSLSASPTIINCAFIENLASGPASGGGIALSSGQPQIIGCLFFNNEGLFGGGIRNDGGRPMIMNCTFVANVARYADCGAAMYAYNTNAEATVINCIFWDNHDGADGIPIVDYFYGAETSVYHSDVQFGWDGLGAETGTNIDADPLFVDPDGGDLRLLPGSPCIDKGDSMAFLETGLDCDLDGNPRPVAGNQGNYLGPFLRRVKAKLIADVDMGAYEFQP